MNVQIIAVKGEKTEHKRGTNATIITGVIADEEANKMPSVW
jgi:hypothetical protein